MAHRNSEARAFIDDPPEPEAPGSPGHRSWSLLPYEYDAAAIAFVAAHPDGADVDSIAAAMGLPRHVVYRDLQRALQKAGEA